MSISTDDMSGTGENQETSARLRGLPSRLLALTAAQADRLVSEGLAGADARKWHYTALVSLQESGPASQATLSRRTGIYRSDMVAVINELAERGMVERAPDPVDRRRNVITMTPRGRRHLRELDALIATAQDDLLSPLTRPERDELVRLLRRLLDHHANTGARPPHGRQG